MVKLKFGGAYPGGPCPNRWKDCVCECGWEYKEDEVVHIRCPGTCEICKYCGSEKCPQCGRHLHCGGCV